ncbi:MAG: hypothetical protein VX205_06720 [Pseudomonadota bacterium]|nr:hypothetical protein [Sphingomonas sp.]MCC4252143.1 hypothetical protein [Sphingobium naphthae]MEC8034671.1 hypothetical protein [Pseudomonadota bacterium]
MQILAGGQCEHIRYAAGAFYLHAAAFFGRIDRDAADQGAQLWNGLQLGMAVVVERLRQLRNLGAVFVGYAWM